MALQGQRVFVAGHRGMVGAAICRRLADIPCDVLTATRDELDLTNQAAVDAWFDRQRPDCVFVAAARVGGILANDTYPVDFLLDNLLIEANVIRAAAASGTRRLIFLGSSCIYPKFADQPITESSLLTGPLEPTNEWYAIAKIAGIKLCQAYRKQYGHNYISAMPCNLYGIGDNFDLQSSHVLPALIRKAHEAKQSGEPLVIWGTGAPRREFLFADDAADAVVHLAEHYDGYEHVNVGAGEDYAIAEIVDIICDIVGFDGELRYDRSKPDGTPRKLMDSSRLRALGWQPAVDLRDGIRQTYEWYLAQ